MHDLYIFGAWLMHSLMVHVGTWLMQFFMVQVEVQVDVWYMLAQVIGIGCYRFIGIGLQ